MRKPRSYTQAHTVTLSAQRKRTLGTSSHKSVPKIRGARKNIWHNSGSLSHNSTEPLSACFATPLDRKFPPIAWSRLGSCLKSAELSVGLCVMLKRCVLYKRGLCERARSIATQSGSTGRYLRSQASWSHECYVEVTLNNVWAPWVQS